MTRRNRTWQGTDANKITSLFEYGLLMRWIPKQKCWQCVYRSGLNTYSYGTVCDNTLEELFTKDWAAKHLESFLKFVGHSWKEWQELSIYSRVSDFLTYFGSEELFGMDYSGGDNTKEICRNLKIKYDVDYEQT
jgi:hypothetical protein|nr:MAG TPA: hypothetical protein [Caudoviricetes sp.]